MKHSSSDATISALDAETSALDVETSAFGAAMSAIARRSFDAMILEIDAETSVLGAAITRSYRRYRRGVHGDIGDCGVGITPQMCNRVTNHGDMSIFSKPAPKEEKTLTFDPFGNCLPITELLQSSFRTEFSMGSRSWCYRRSLRRHRQFLRSYRRSLRLCRDPLGDRRLRACWCGDSDRCALTKHWKT